MHMCEVTYKIKQDKFDKLRGDLQIKQIDAHFPISKHMFWFGSQHEIISINNFHHHNRGV